jgi:excisionase family DNA binding protein
MGAREERVEIPESLYAVLRIAVRALTAGRAVSILSSDVELTTQQAADLLNVSRPHLISLLEAGKFPFHKVGTHRRIALADLLTYRDQRDAARDQFLREFAREAQEAGVY